MSGFCFARSDSGVVCSKPVHPREENHWGNDLNGRDVVWAEVRIDPPKKEKS